MHFHAAINSRAAMDSRAALLRTSVSLLALALTAAGALAQARPEGRDSGTIALDEITVTASRQEERAIDALAAVSLTTRSELRTQQPQRLGTVVSQMPGVTTQENPNDPATAINIRGLQDFGRVAVTVDGARQNFQRSGHNANGAFFLDPAFVRVIDVTRGPVANVGGTGVFGRQGGLYGNVLAAARPADWISGMAGLSFRSLDPYKDGKGNSIADSYQELMSGIGKIVLTPGEGQGLKLGGQYQRYEFANGAGSATAPRRDNEVTTQNYTAQYSFSRPDIPWLNLKLSAYSTSTDTEQTRTSGTAAQRGQSRYFKITTTGFDIANTSKFDFGHSSLALTYGVDWFEDKVDTLDIASNGDETTPSGKRSVYGGFVQAHYRWSIVDVIGALRYDGYELSGGRTSSEGDRISPKLTIGVTPLTGFQIYGTYAEGYRAPSITETLVDGLHPAPSTFVFRPNPNLKPEVGRTIEAGVNLKYDNVLSAGDKFRGKVSIFQNDVDDFIDGIFTDPGNLCSTRLICGNSFYTYQNVAKARLTGAEAEFSYDAGRWFATLAGSTTRGDNRTNGDPLQSIYPDKLIVGAGLRFLDEKLTVSGRLTLVDEQRRLPTAALATASKSYALVDLQADYKITPDARAFVTLENIGDVRYKRYRDGDYSAGFVGKIGFSTRFGT